MDIFSLKISTKKKFRLLATILIIQLVIFFSGNLYSQIPDFQWAKGLGGHQSTFGTSIAVDETGNVYTTGHFKGSVDLDPGPGTSMINSFGNDDGYISKLDVDGNFVWGRQIGGTDWDKATALTLDASNNIYVVGYFEGTASFGPFSLTATGPRDIFVCKLDDQGNFLWVKGMNGSGSNLPTAITTDIQNNVIITGGFVETVDFDPGPTTYNLTSQGLRDIFVVKLNPLGDFMWAKQMGGTDTEWADGITVDGANNILLTGNFYGTSDFSGVILTTDESTDVFVCKLANNGNLIWVKQFAGVVTGTSLGGSLGNPIVINIGSNGHGRGIVTDAMGNVYTTGFYKGNVDFDPGPSTYYIPSVDSIHNNIFVSKLNTQGDFEWAKMIGNNETCESWAIDVNAMGYVYFTGKFFRTVDFDPGGGTFNLTSGYASGGSDAFIGVLDDIGNFVWAGQFKGATANVNVGWAIKADDLGRIYTTGYFGKNVDFDPGPNTYEMWTQIPQNSNPDAFVHKIADTLRASFSTSSDAICAGDSIIFTDLSTGMGIQRWNWTFNGGTPVSSNAQGPHTITFSTPGTYNITLEIEDDLTDTDDTTIVVTVHGLPNSTATNDGPVCLGNTVNLNATGGNVYSWTGPNGFTGSSNNITIPNITAAQMGTYIVTVTDNNGCIDTSHTVIDVTSLSLSTSKEDVSCFGGSNGEATVTPTGASPYTYSWSPSGGTNATASNLSHGSYSVTVIDDNGCEETANITIGQPTAISLSVSSTDSDCSVDNGTATVTASGGNGGFTYLWTPSGQTAATATGIGAGSYTVLVTDSKNCTASQSVNVNSHNAPIVTINNVQNPTCANDNNGSAEASATGGIPPYSFSWSPSGGSNAIANNLSAGNYTVQVIDGGGCIGTQTVTINAPSAIHAASIITPTNCGESNGSISITPNGGNSNYSYNWANGETTSSLTNITAGTYPVTITDDLGCTLDTSFVITTTGNLTIQALPEQASIEAGDTIGLTVNIDPGVSNETYNWTPTSGLSCIDCPNPNASPSVSTTYYVTVETPDGCSSSDYIHIEIRDNCGEVFVPTIFSPNTDGLNDELCVLGDCINFFEFTIYNRWGEIVFATTDQNECWDGTFKGKKMNTGVFVYKLRVTTQQGEEIEESGNINLIR